VKKNTVGKFYGFIKQNTDSTLVLYQLSSV